jgi:hypothetical protein
MSDSTGKGPLATTTDIVNLWRPLTDSEQQRAEYLLKAASDTLRQTAKNRGYDLDKMLEDGDIYESVAIDVVIAAVTRILRSSTTSEPMTQFSQSALGYSVSGTYLNPQGGIFFYDNELSRLGLRKRQKLGRIDLYELDDGDSGGLV